ncbi:hypothetical protein EYF80_013446 [Liparis tanakae]|uniref:Uncharacterized protein n=1 Tax=Liparis tanakae TaxID=230148 RepID=A0A4Z2IEU2_9TELE|nr:hypothetical protein EYF80_013446 [Liparis tanakae]
MFRYISGDKLPAFSKESRMIPTGFTKGRRESGTKSAAGRPSKGTLLCPLPHCSANITVGTRTETDLKGKGLHPRSAICGSQAAGLARRPQTSDPGAPQPQAAVRQSLRRISPLSSASSMHQQT